jgi:chromate reductase, NAD(P)H dehydrogenase (quinone)
MRQLKILAFSGSARRDSWNQRLVRIAAGYARELGCEVTELNLGELELPIFDEDLEKGGTPAGATRLKQLMFAHQALLIACPEYNSSITPLLKNSIDWASRPAAGEKPLQAFRGKVCGLMSASPGALGGLRGLVHVRAILGNIGVLVIPDQVAVGSVHNSLNENGNDLQEGSSRTMLRNVVSEVARVADLIHQS